MLGSLLGKYSPSNFFPIVLTASTMSSISAGLVIGFSVKKVIFTVKCFLSKLIGINMTGNSVATKTIRADKDGIITKILFNCGKHFTHRQETVTDVWSLGGVIQGQEDKFKEFIIRGDPLKTNKSKIVARCGEGNKEASFKDVGTPPLSCVICNNFLLLSG